jgi:hypothetical protein
MKDFSNMNSFSWDELVTELSDRCPVLFNALLVAMGRSKEEVKDVGPRIGMCYAILMQTRNHELSLVQRINTVLMTNGGAKKQVTIYWHRDGFTGGCTPLGPGQRECRGVLFFMIKQKIIRDKMRDKMRYSNLSNNMLISEL